MPNTTASEEPTKALHVTEAEAEVIEHALVIYANMTARPDPTNADNVLLPKHVASALRKFRTF